MFLKAALVQVIWPGSEVPGPPRGGPKNTLPLGSGGGEGFTEATSNVRLPVACPKASAHAKAAITALGSMRRILKWAEPYGFNFPIRVQHESPLRRTVLELHLINVGARRSDSFESDRLHRAKLINGGFELRQLLAGDIGEACTHELVFWLPEPQLFDVAAQRSFRSRGLGLILESLGSGGRGISDFLRLDVVQPRADHVPSVLVKDQLGGLSASGRSREFDLGVHDLGEKHGLRLGK